MPFLLAPVETGPDERTTLLRELMEVDAELLKAGRRGAESITVAVVDEGVLAFERCGQLDPEAAGQVVVAGAGLAHGSVMAYFSRRCRTWG